RDSGIDIILHLYDREIDIESIIEVAIFRIIQEALNNIKKHSRAKKTIIALSIKDGKLIGTITDDGIGFDIQKIKRPKKGLNYTNGFGIYNMRQRAELLEGRLDIKSCKGEGTVIRLEIPLSLNTHYIE